MKHSGWLRSHVILQVGVLAGLAVAGGSASAQEDDYRLPGPVPAPIRFIAADQKAQIDAEAEPKKRAKLMLDLAEARLAQAEALTTQQDFTGAALELGNYQGLVHDSIVYLQAIPPKGNTARDLFKRLEITLRTDCPRLENIRRTTPLNYASNIKDVIHFTEDSRDTSLSCFFGETVLPEKDGGASTKSAATPSAGAAKQSP